MHADRKGPIMSSILLSNKHQFEETLSEFRNKINTLDDNFLIRLSHLLELKHSIFSEEISSLVLVIATAAIATKKPELAKKEEINANSFLRVEELSQLIYKHNGLISLQMVQPEMVGWTSKVWDKIVHSSCFRNIIDLLVLCFFVGDSLLEHEKELKRLSRLLLLAFGKIKTISDDTLQLTIFILNHLSRKCDERNYSFDLKVKMKILLILYLSRITKRSEEETIIIKECLEQFYSKCLEYFINYLSKIEEFGGGREEDIIWDRLFVTILRTFHRQPPLEKISKQILIEMLNFRIDMQTVKLMIRELQISDDSCPLEKWKQVFSLLEIAVRLYDSPKTVINFSSSKSYFKLPLEVGRNFSVKINLKNSWKLYGQEKFLMMVQDKQKKEELWITTINSVQGELKLMLLRVLNRNILEQTQQFISWSQNTTAEFVIEFSQEEITLQVGSQKKNRVSIQRFMKQPFSLVLGDCDNTLGTSIKSFQSISIFDKDSSKTRNVPLDLSVKSFQWRGLRKKVIPSFVQIFRSLGDMDIYLLIVSHALRKMKEDPAVTDMIRISLSLMQNFVQVKQVKQKQLRKEEREERLNSILCLCWQCSNETKNALAVLELLRVLSIRGIPNPEDELEVLCNFVFWKQFQWEYQRLIIMKIKQIFIGYRFYDCYLKPVHKYCKRIVMETVLYYREEDFLVTTQQRQHVLKIHYEFISLLENQMLSQIRIKKQIELVYDFLEFLIKVCSLTISKRSYHDIEAFDLTLSIQISMLSRVIGEELRQWEGDELRLHKLIKCIIEVCSLYDMEEYYFFQKKLLVFRGEEGFAAYHQSTIKTNLYSLAYKLVSLRPQLLFSMADLEQKGIAEITSIGWSKEFFDKITPQSKDANFLLERKGDNTGNYRQIFQKLPLKYLSMEQSGVLLQLYLKHDQMFPSICFKLADHFWTKLGIEKVISIMSAELLSNLKEGSSISQTQISKIIEADSCLNLSLFTKKVICLLLACQDLASWQGLFILNTMKRFELHSHSEQYTLTLYHFILHNLIEKTKNMMNNSEPSIPLRSCIDLELTSPKSSIELPESSDTTREDYASCMEYYLTHLSIMDIMQVKGSESVEEGEGHLQNCKLQLTIMINHLTNHQNHSMNELKKYYQFLQTQILPLSKHYLQNYGLIPVISEKSKSTRKRSRHFQFPAFELQEEVKTMYNQFMDERNENILKVEKVWNKIEQRNKYFWSSFLPKETVFNLHENTGHWNERYLLKKANKREKLELPRMHKASIIKSTSIVSDKFDASQTESVSSIFEDAHLYRKEGASCLSFQRELLPKEGRINKFSVLLVTSSKIYQGVLVIGNKRLSFTENEVINEGLYAKVFATEFERRHEDECILQNYKVQEELSHRCIAIVKRYLFLDIALEIVTKNRSYFFSFLKKDHRQACLILLGKHIRVIRRDSIPEEVKLLSSKWGTGEISNYSYLMNINNIAGRSFNDLSQYYVFPWTVTNFTDKLDLQFFSRKDNFRELSYPVGKINRSKWENIKKNYERTKKDEIPGIKPFLYGSFYSNPAIVSNFLIRINPFSFQHFELQSKQFDLADRLFYSVPDSFKSLNQCSSDFKQLIPEFYFFPEFLKNRNQYNLGLRQNKDIVNNVTLPCWAQDQYQFVFRMRKMLECGQVTQNVHSWIDLIFGVYSKREYAIRADNLFLQDLYLESSQAQAKQKNKDFMMYYKEFGQVPVPIFSWNHQPCKVLPNSLDLIGHSSIGIEENFLHNNIYGKLIQIYYTKKFTFLLFEKQLRMYVEQKFESKDYIALSGDFEGGSVKFWEIFDEKQKKHYCLLIHRKKTHQLVAYEIKKNIFNNFSLEGGEVLQFKHRIEHVTLYDNMIICSEGKNIYIYRNIHQEMEEEFSSLNCSLGMTIAKVKYLFAIGFQFTQHKSRVIFLGATERGIIVSVDEEYKVYIVEIYSGALNIYNYFQIRSTNLEESISEIIIHTQGFIILRTDRERLLMFTLLGDRIVDQMLQFKKTTQDAFTEKITTMTLWNPEFTELIVGTNLGNLWKIDPFAVRRCEEIEETEVWIQKIYLNREGFRKESIIKVATNRIGRHSLTLAYGENSKLYALKSSKWDQMRKASMAAKKLK